MNFPQKLNVLFLTPRCLIATGVSLKKSENSFGRHCVTDRGTEAMLWFMERYIRNDPFDAVVVEIGVFPPDLENALRAFRVLDSKIELILFYLRATKLGKFNCKYHKELADDHAMQVAWSEDQLIALIQGLEENSPAALMKAV